MKGELCVKSGYNFLDSTLKISDIIDKGKEEGYQYLGLVDKNIMHGHAYFYFQCLKNNIHPVLGLEIEYEKDAPISLLAKTNKGYQNLVKISSFINGNSESELKEVLEKYNQDLICVVPSYRFFKNFNKQQYQPKIEKFKKIYSQVFIGEEHYNIKNLDRINLNLKEIDIEAIHFSNIKAKKEEDLENIEVLKAIKNNKIIGFNREGKNKDYTCFKSLDEKRNIFDYKALNLGEKIAFSCKVKLEKRKPNLPKLKYSEKEVDQKKYLRGLVKKGLEKRGIEENRKEEYEARLKKELDIIFKMGFESYFLIVYDYVKFAKNNNIIVGPGRGSSASSLVSYCLGINNVDPIKYNLLFERFLNPKRISMPDIDLDFQDNKRDSIVKYLKEKYGITKVGNIVTFSKLSTKQALRDVGRVHGLERKDLDKLSKACGTGFDNLQKLYENSNIFKKLIDSENKFMEIFNIAKKIENLPRQTSIHAAGIVLSNEDLDKTIPTFQDSANNLIVQYDMDYSEFFGLLKMDILGLKNLTIIDECLKKISFLEKKEIKINDIDIEDPNIYKYIANGNTSGLFQLESKGMGETIKTVNPTHFQDLSAILALYRPGPRDFIQDFAKRKHKTQRIEYIDESLKDILKETYGIIVYQEQIMQIVQQFAGLSLEKADLLRRAISKKKSEQMDQIRKDFIKGAISLNRDEKKAIEVFDLILKFANYGFNKAHSVSYAMISSVMAWIKMKYPAVFFSSVMNNFVGGSSEKFIQYVRECKQNDIKINLPSVNYSLDEFYPLTKNNIYYSLSHIKGISNQIVNEILKEREKAKFRDYEDFLLRMIKRRMSKSQFTILVDSGALDEFGYNRETMKKNFKNFEDFFKLANYEKEGQLKLNLESFALPKIEKYKEATQKLGLEYELLGIFISGFPLKEKRDVINKKGLMTIKKIKTFSNYYIKGAFMIKSVKIIRTKKNREMAILMCMDEFGEIEVVVFPDLYDKKASLITKGEFIVVEGKLKKDKDISIIGDNIDKLKEWFK